MKRWPAPGLAFIFLWFLVGGIAHFAFTATEMKIVPPWLLWPRAIVLVTGLMELAGAAGLAWPRTRKAAAWALFAFTIAVTPANVYMLQHAELFPAVPVWALIARLPLQVLLLVLIARIALRADSRAKSHA